MKRIRCALLLALALALSCAAGAVPAGEREVSLHLSHRGVTVDGRPAPTSAGDAVFVTRDAGALRVTIARPGVYRVSGALGHGQLAVEAEGAVTLILDGADVACASGPALLFAKTGRDDTARLVLADGTVSRLSAAQAAEGGALCARVPLCVDAETAGGTCALQIVSEGDGLTASAPLTLLGGDLHIDARQDGVRTEGDAGLTVDGGVLTVSAGLDGGGNALRAGGDLTLRGGDLILLAGDTGRALRAGGAVLLDGGKLAALGGRPSAVDRASSQPSLSLSFPAALPAGSRLTVRDTAGGVLRDYTAVRPFASALLSSPLLDGAKTYTVHVDKLQQQYGGSGGDMTFGCAAFRLLGQSDAFSGLTGFGTVPFTDVGPDDARYDGVRYVFGMGIMNGVQRDVFSPDRPVSRAMAVTVLGRMAGAAAAGTDAFPDVPAGAWYGGYLGWAAEAGIVQGDGQGRFRPNSAVTGEQMALMLSRFARQAGQRSPVTNGSKEPLSRGELAQMLMAFGQVD